MPAFSADDGIAVVTDGDGTNIAIGDKADSRKMNGDNSISIGKSSSIGYGNNSIAVGTSYYVTSSDAIAIGTNSLARANGTIVIGKNAKSGGGQGVVIGEMSTPRCLTVRLISLALTEGATKLPGMFMTIKSTVMHHGEQEITVPSYRGDQRMVVSFTLAHYYVCSKPWISGH
ncbi:hypothetical protein H5959_26530 [Escherichia coli]|nr:hypothetical protein [Escherichia coli]